MLWVETETNADAERLRSSIWDPVLSMDADGAITGRSPGSREAGNEFWYDTLQREKADPTRRYEIARRHLPLPAAWREMAIALRAMIKDSRKAERDFQPELRELHQLAGIWSFSDPAPSGRAGSAYRIMELTPYARLAALDLSWDRIGCDELSLLNQTDRKLMRSVWGEPKTHSTACLLYRKLFLEELKRVDEAEERLRNASVERSMARFEQLHRERDRQRSRLKPGILASLWERLRGA